MLVRILSVVYHIRENVTKCEGGGPRFDTIFSKFRIKSREPSHSMGRLPRGVDILNLRR